MQRYVRNTAIPQIGEDGQVRLLNSRVLVVGAGGLGSSVIANLSSLGVGVIGIVDPDYVELSNLNRQFIHNIQNLGRSKVDSAALWIQNYNPDIQVSKYKSYLDKSNYKEIVKDYDLIVDCVDGYKSKFFLNEICINLEIPLVHGGVSGFCGQVLTVIPKKTACLGCVFGVPDENCYEEKGVVSPAVSTIGSIQSLQVLKLLLNLDGLLTDRILFFDGAKMTFKELKISKSRHCTFCGK